MPESESAVTVRPTEPSRFPPDGFVFQMQFNSAFENHLLQNSFSGRCRWLGCLCLLLLSSPCI